MDDLLVEFLTETNEALEVVDNELVRLERNPNDKDVLANIFRLVHTIKGTCGFLGLPRLEKVAHAAENILGKIRDGEQIVTPPLVSLILESLDCIKLIVRGIEHNATEPAGDDSALIHRLALALEGQIDSCAPTPDDIDIHDTSAPEAETVVTNDHEDMVAEIVASATAQTKPQAITDTENSDTTARLNDEPPSKTGSQNIRVSVELLENLMTLVSELVLTRNQLTQLVRKSDNSEFAIPVQRLSQCTSELQEGVMKTRMQPIGSAWGKLPRIVRDLSVELGKKISLDMKGAETELDRQVLELIKDPLTHMVRNSADHGIESPEVRRQNGKNETGHIRLNAFHEGGQIVIEIADDGRGLNLARLKQKAVDAGLVSAAEAQALSDAQIQKFIFHPGLSTAEAVTSVSGRGVGMDVVRSNIEKIGGTIDVFSQTGKGTKFAIKIPLTLAIVAALIVESGKERFAIPQISVLELVRAAADSEHRVEMINQTPVLRLRNRLLPLVYMHEMLGLQTSQKVNDEVFVVVTQVGAFMFGIVVDEVFDTEEIVVKPVAPILKHINVYSGNTILGDGSVIMILDPIGIASSTAQGNMDSEQDNSAEQIASAAASDRENMLLFRAGDATPKAVPLSLVARLEDVEIPSIEFSEGRPMVQYRDKLMPLVLIDEQCSLRSEGRQPVLVFQDGDFIMGLVVDDILDIVETELSVELSAERKGRVGTSIINGKVTEVVDVGHYFSLAFRDFLRTPSGDDDLTSQKERRQRKILLVDDSSFFRTMLKPLLAASGYQVTTASDAAQALKLREEGEVYDLIISDIEMPGLTGFEFAQNVRANGTWSDIPMIALTALTRATDVERGRLSGFNDYVAKFDRDELINIIDRQLNTHAEAA